MKFAKGVSGNAKGYPRGKPHKRTAAVRKAIADNTGKIIAAIIKDALAGDVAARQLFVHRLMPRHRFVSEPVSLPPAKDLAEARLQIGRLASLAAGGDLDLDSMKEIAQVMAMAIGVRAEELEDLVAEREAQAPDDTDR